MENQIVEVQVKAFWLPKKEFNEALTSFLERHMSIDEYVYNEEDQTILFGEVKNPDSALAVVRALALYGDLKRGCVGLNEYQDRLVALIGIQTKDAR